MTRKERKAPVGIIGGTTLKTDWQTPPHLVEAVREYFGGAIPFDSATALDNPCAAATFAAVAVAGQLMRTPVNGGHHVAVDGLAHTWPARAWMNPPYGKTIRHWYLKAADEAARGVEIVALLPCSRWEQGYFQECMAQANALCYIRKRVKFINPSTGDAVSGNTYANMFVGWNVEPRLWRLAFKGLGACFEMRPLSGPPDGPIDRITGDPINTTTRRKA